MNSSEKDLLEQVAVTPELFVSRVFAEHWHEIKMTALESIHINATPTENLEIAQSKFGGHPWLPKEFDYPVDPEGNPMFLLAQLNFDEIPELEGYPATGILQFYISMSEDLLYGLDFDNMNRRDGFKILYFENIQNIHHQTELPIPLATLYTLNTPLAGSHALQFQKHTEYVGIMDVRYEEFGNFKIDNWTEIHPEIKEELDDEAYEKFTHKGHKIGGYAYFTQWDPRPNTNKILLLQIDSGAKIMWGDAGVGNFFIDPEDLKNKDFSKVLYNWDCG